MQVEAAASLAPVLARFAIVVDGPLEAAVLSRLVTGGERATTLAQLARPFPGRPDLPPAEAVALARAVVTRLMAGGTVEHVGGGYRISDPALAATLQRVVDAVATARAGPRPVIAAPVLPTGAAVLPVAVEDASRVLQQTLGAHWVSTATLGGVPGATAGPSSPVTWAPLLHAGWTVQDGGSAGAPVMALASDARSLPALRVVVADPSAPPVAAAARLAARAPVEVVHLPAAPVKWGQGDAGAARRQGDQLAVVFAQPAATARSPVVVDRGLVPGMVVLAQEQRLPAVVVVDLRAATGAPIAPPPGAPGPGSLEPSVMAAAIAGAAGASAPPRRALARRGARRGLADLLDVLFGRGFARALLEAERGGATGEGGPSGAVVRPVDSDEQDTDEPVAPVLAGGLVVTARTDDPQAEALGELLGVEVIHLAAGDDLGPEVMAWLEDGDGRRLLAPQA